MQGWSTEACRNVFHNSAPAKSKKTEPVKNCNSSWRHGNLEAMPMLNSKRFELSKRSKFTWEMNVQPWYCPPSDSTHCRCCSPRIGIVRKQGMTNVLCMNPTSVQPISATQVKHTDPYICMLYLRRSSLLWKLLEGHPKMRCTQSSYLIWWVRPVFNFHCKIAALPPRSSKTRYVLTANFPLYKAWF